MNFFEQELRKIIGQSTAAADASYLLPLSAGRLLQSDC